MLFIPGNSIFAAQGDVKVVEVMLGSYRFMPHEIQLIANEPVILRLVNSDAIIPHNFTIQDASGELNVNVDVLAGETVDINLTPSTVGRYTFYCGNKLLFMKSHREKGMEGILSVVPQSQ
jgi:heme/copper-type cytochrome/quinol oxidase subunit 2